MESYGRPLTDPLRLGNGSASAPTYSFAAATNSGMFRQADGSLGWTLGGTASVAIYSLTLGIASTGSLAWATAGNIAPYDVLLLRDGAAGILAQKDGTNAQQFRIYGTTTGPKYLQLLHDGTNSAVFSQAGVLKIGTTANATVDVYVNNATAWQWTTLGLSCTSGNQRFSHGVAALATNATEGFFHLGSCAGVPTGTPATIPTGQKPAVYDSNADQLNFFSTSWKALPRTLDVNVTAVGNVGAGTDDLITFAIPANVLVTNNKTIRIKAWGTTANNVNAKTLTFVVGSQTVVTTALTTSIAGMWEIEVVITRTGASTQDIVARVLQGATLIFDQELTAGTQTETATITVKCTGNATSNNDIVQEGMITEVIN